MLKSSRVFPLECPGKCKVSGRLLQWVIGSGVMFALTAESCWAGVASAGNCSMMSPAVSGLLFFALTAGAAGMGDTCVTVSMSEVIYASPKACLKVSTKSSFSQVNNSTSMVLFSL